MKISMQIDDVDLDTATRIIDAIAGIGMDSKSGATVSVTTDEELDLPTSPEPNKELTLEQVRDAVQAYGKEHGTPAVVNILQELNVARVADLEPDDWPALMEKIARKA